jgi:DNA-binding winged helix-turn-helix (wHTH) protein
LADIEQDGIAIGEWRFVAAEDELRRGGERRKLEHRAARTLELLCRRRGETVSREAILEAVWQGRAVSANSVAIVISDLREALGDTARSPTHIETVAKRGYRLRAEAAGAAPSPKVPRLALLIAALGLLVVFAATAQHFFVTPATRLAVAEVVDETGDARYAPLAKASSAVLLESAQKLSGASVIPLGRGGTQGGRSAVLLQARLILWSGKPTLMMSATDLDGKVIWTAMSHGGEDSIPGDVRAAMRDLKPKLTAR